MAENTEYAKVVGGPDREEIDFFLEDGRGELSFHVQDLRAHCLPYPITFVVGETTELSEIFGMKIAGKVAMREDVASAMIIYNPEARSGWITWTW